MRLAKNSGPGDRTPEADRSITSIANSNVFTLRLNIEIGELIVKTYYY
jgi:hypothetical protein